MHYRALSPRSWAPSGTPHSPGPLSCPLVGLGTGGHPANAELGRNLGLGVARAAQRPPSLLDRWEPVLT